MTHMDKTLDISVAGLSCVDTIAAGEFSKPTVQNRVGDVHISAGGLGNALVALSGLDVGVGVSTRVGDDMYGDYLLKQWRELGIDTSGVTVDRDRATGFSFILNHGVERTPFYSAGANSVFGLGDIPALLAENSRCMLVFFAGALPSLDGEPMVELVKRCHAARTVVILDACDSVVADYRAIPSYLPYANLVVSSEEGRAITGKDAHEDVLKALDTMAGGASDGPSFLAVTRCDGVSLLSREHGYMDVATPFYGRPVHNVVGAGDAFRAGLAAYIAAHYEDYWHGRLDYHELCLFASAVSYSYLSRGKDVRPFSMGDIRLLLAERGD